MRLRHLGAFGVDVRDCRGQIEVQGASNTFPKPLILRAHEYGAPKFDSLQVLSYSSRFRAATETMSGLEDNKSKLEQAESEHGNLALAAGQAHSLPWWDRPPMVNRALEAKQGFGGVVGGIIDAVQLGRALNRERKKKAFKP